MKKVFAILLLLTFIISLIPCVHAEKTQYYYDGAWHEYQGNIFRLEVDGELLQTEMPPIVFNDYSVVPARDVFEKLGALVEWEATKERVTISKGSMVVEVTINSKTAYVRGKAETMQIAPKIINGKTMIPVRFVGDTLGYFVDFDSDTDTVIIRKNETVEKTYVTKAKYSENNDSLTLTLTTTSDEASIDSFILENPMRLVVDVKNAEFTPLPSNKSFSGGNITGVRFGQSEDARVVFDLVKKTEYEITKSGKQVIITVSDEKTAEQTLKPPKQTAEPESTKPPEAVSTKAPSATPTPVPFSLEINATGGRDYVKVTSASVGKATRVSSPVSVTFELTGENLPQKETETKQSANFVQTVKYTPISKQKATVTLFIKDNNFNLVQTNSSLYIMAQKAEKLRSVMIDAGHGGDDVGAVGRDEDGNIIAMEKDFNLDVALKVQKILKANNVDVKMIRQNDIYVDFQQVGSIANDAQTTLFVSIHTNSAVAESANGIETWAYLEDNASSLNGITGERLAEIVQNELIYETKAVDRGIKNGKSLAVIKTTSMPAILVEMGFISNQAECEKLMTESYRQKIANAVAAGVLAAFEEMGI